MFYLLHDEIIFVEGGFYSSGSREAIVNAMPFISLHGMSSLDASTNIIMQQVKHSHHILSLLERTSFLLDHFSGVCSFVILGNHCKYITWD